MCLTENQKELFNQGYDDIGAVDVRPILHDPAIEGKVRVPTGPCFQVPPPFRSPRGRRTRGTRGRRAIY